MKYHRTFGTYMIGIAQFQSIAVRAQVEQKAAGWTTVRVKVIKIMRLHIHYPNP